MNFEIEKDLIQQKKSLDLWTKLRVFLNHREDNDCVKLDKKLPVEIPKIMDPAVALLRFKNAQDSNYKDVLKELQNGRKDTHWIWYVFPQIQGIGRSDTCRYFSIKSIEEAENYLKDPVLGKRLHECTQLILDIPDKNAIDIFGVTDYLKVKSSMTLFCNASPENPIFKEVLDKYFKSEFDEKTILILEKLKKTKRNTVGE